MRSPILPLALAVFGLAGTPVGAQDATVIGNNTVLPGTGPGTATDGSSAGRMMEAASAEDAAKRQGLKPAAFLATTMIGVEVRNAAGESVGKIDDLLITDGGTFKAVVIDVGGFSDWATSASRWIPARWSCGRGGAASRRSSP